MLVCSPCVSLILKNIQFNKMAILCLVFDVKVRCVVDHTSGKYEISIKVFNYV